MFASATPRGDAIVSGCKDASLECAALNGIFVASVSPIHGQCLRKLVILCCTAFLWSIWD